MKASRFVTVLGVLALGVWGQRSAAGDAVDVDISQYRYWPEYRKVPVDQVRPQPWRDRDDVIDGWDWSLPPHVTPNRNSLLCVTRRANNLPSLNFPANPVVSLWVFWSDLEPEENRYRFDTLVAQLKEIEQAGYGAIIRPMTAVYARPSYPDASQTPQSRKKPCAPPYLVTEYNVPQIPGGNKGDILLFLL